MNILCSANVPKTTYRWSKYEQRHKQRIQKIHQKVKDVAKELDAIAKEDVEYTKSLFIEPEIIETTDLFDP